MASIIVIDQKAALSNSVFNTDLFSRWTAYIDATPKTVETYTKAIKRFSSYLFENAVTEPTRETVIEYREYLKHDHKPTTVQCYLAAVKLFFQWTNQEGLYPNIADHVKGAKLDTEHKKDYLTTKQVSRLLNGIDKTSLKGLSPILSRQRARRKSGIRKVSRADRGSNPRISESERREKPESPTFWLHSQQEQRRAYDYTKHKPNRKRAISSHRIRQRPSDRSQPAAYRRNAESTERRHRRRNSTAPRTQEYKYDADIQSRTGTRQEQQREAHSKSYIWLSILNSVYAI